LCVRDSLEVSSLFLGGSLGVVGQRKCAVLGPTIESFIYSGPI